MPKVSIIIPVYNTEKYVKEAMLSILNQTLRDIQLIAVDDGSTDNSLDIINSVALTDNRVIILSQPNKGQSEARNFGLTKAVGDYLYFMDSDDILLETALEECVNKADKEKLDLVFFDADIFSEVKDFCLGLDYARLDQLEDKLYKGIDVLDELIIKRIYRVSPCLYLINKEYFEKSKIKFYPGIIHEDELFTSLIYLKANDVAFINKQFFLRRLRENSVMTNTFGEKNMKGYLTVVSELKKYYNIAKGREKEVLYKLIVGILNDSVYKAYNMPFFKKIRLMYVVVMSNYKYITFRTLATLMLKKYKK